MSHKRELEVQIEGMTCGSCEILIERKFKQIPGVKAVKVSQLEGKAHIYCKRKPSLNELQNAIAADGYKVIVDGQAVQDGIISHNRKNTANDYWQISTMVLLIFALYLILKQFNLFDGLGVSQNMDYWFILLIGLVAGSSSCIAVTGGVLLSVAAKYNQSIVPAMDGTISAWKKFKPHLYFNVGRIISYTILGGVLGFIGSTLTISPAFTGAISLIASFFMIMMGLNILNLFPGLRKLMPKPPKFLSNKILDLEGKSGKWIPFAMGALTFFLPCGFTQSLQIYVLSKGSWMQGAITMFLFSLGTLPALLSLSAVSSFAKGWFRNSFLKFSGVLVLIIGLSNIGNGFALLGINPTNIVTNIFNSGSTTAEANDGTAPRIENGKQIIEMTVNGYTYTPNRFKVYQGIPVEWRVDGRNAQGCGRVLVVPSLGLTEFMPQDSIKTITFTPKDLGSISFNCTMGMMTPNSAFIVIPNTLNTAPSSAIQPTEQENTIQGDTQEIIDTSTEGITESAEGTTDGTTESNTENSSDTHSLQKVKIVVGENGFQPSENVVKKGIPVEVTVNVEQQLSGCMSIMVIPELGVSVPLKLGQNKFKFTPTQTGVLDAVCPMGIWMTSFKVI